MKGRRTPRAPVKRHNSDKTRHRKIKQQKLARRKRRQSQR